MHSISYHLVFQPELICEIYQQFDRSCFPIDDGLETNLKTR